MHCWSHLNTLARQNCWQRCSKTQKFKVVRDVCNWHSSTCHKCRISYRCFLPSWIAVHSTISTSTVTTDVHLPLHSCFTCPQHSTILPSHTRWLKSRLKKSERTICVICHYPANMIAEHGNDSWERHDEMAEYTQRLGEQPAELLVEERISAWICEQIADVHVPQVPRSQSYRVRWRSCRTPSTHQFRRLWKNWRKPPRFSLRTGFNDVSKDRSCRRR